MTPTSPAVDLVDLERLLAEYNNALATGSIRAYREASTKLQSVLVSSAPALISELTELRASRSLMEEAVRALEPFARVANSSGFAIGRPVERVTDEDFRRAQSALTTIKEKTT